LASTAFIIIVGAFLVSVPRISQAATSNPVGIAIPLYTYPTGGTWSAVITAKQAHPNVPFIAVINPNNGPGASSDSNYAQGIKNLQAAGVTVLGYVYTSYASRSIASAEADVNSYRSWYAVNGILFDEMNNVAGNEAYYSTLNNYVHSLGMSKTMGNPGTSVPTSFIGTMDSLCIYESSGYPSLSFVTYPGYSPSNFCVIAFGVSQNTSFLTSLPGTASWVYATDANLPNPYGALPSYFNSEVAALSVIDGTTTTTSSTSTTSSPSTSTVSTTSTSSTASTTSTTSTSTGATHSVTVNSVDLLGTPFSGMWTTWSQNAAVLATGYTSVTFSGNAGATYAVTVANYANYVFCHWQGGGTSSTRTLALGGNVVLTAYYSTTGACPTAPVTYSIGVKSVYLNGGALTGVPATVKTGGTTVASGNTPLTFTATSGLTYSIAVSNSGGLVFDHWSTGSTSSTLVLAPSSSTTLTAYFRSPVALTVNSLNTVGGSVIGVQATIKSGSTIVSTGLTPLSATVLTGTSYTVNVLAPAGWVFSHWQNGSTNPTLTVNPTQTTTLTAYFTKLPTSFAVTITSKSVTGVQFTGMYLSVTANGNVVASGYTTLTFTATAGVTYTISMSNWQNFVFAHWENGSTNSVRTQTFTLSTTLIAYYNTGGVF
jgi:hypothetical protein